MEMSSPPTTPGPPALAFAALPRRAALPLLAMLVLLGIAVLHYLGYAAGAVRFAYAIDYGEGIVWKQMAMMLAGDGYAPLQPYPAIVFHYPPLYHIVTAALAALGGLPPLMAGRLVSVLGALATAAFAGACVVRLSRQRGPAPAWPAWIGGLATFGIVFATKPVLAWSVLMRIDMLALALGFAGLWLGLAALTRPRAIQGAALCFVAALFTKQTMLAAPAAVFGVLLLARPRVALAGLATALGTGLVALGALTAATHGQFLQHIVGYNLNRFDAEGGMEIVRVGTVHIGYLAVAIGSLVALWRRAGGKGSVIARLAVDPALAGLAILSLHALLATAMLAMVFKSGASINYFLEWIVIVAMLDGLAIARLAQTLAHGERASRLARTAPWLIAAQALVLPLAFGSDYEWLRATEGDLALATEVMRAAPGPVVSDDMVMLMSTGKPVLVEPAIFTELSARGRLDDAPLLDRIRARRFPFLLTQGRDNSWLFHARYTDRARAAILAGYPREIEFRNRYILRFPPGPLPAWIAPLSRRLPAPR